MTTIALVAGMLPLVIAGGTGSSTNRSIGILVVGGQSLCLLLTLLAVPVFYSLFDDAKQIRLWSRITAKWRGQSEAQPRRRQDSVPVGVQPADIPPPAGDRY